MSELAKLKSEWMKEPAFAAEYNALEEEFDLAHTLISARAKLGISQLEVARRMQTKQSVVARLEASGATPNIQTLRRYAAAVGCKLSIALNQDQRLPTA
jgi:ribosome-binding protein aMBF1 (putative translation factor)